MKNKLRLSLQVFKDWLIPFLKGQAVKAALKKILGSAVMGGFQGWLVKYVVTELYEEIGEPIIKMALNHMGYLYDRQKGKVLIKRLNNAEDENTYNTISDDIFTR